MNRQYLAVLALFVLLHCACNNSELSYDYSNALGSKSNAPLSASGGTVAVQLKIEKGLTRAEDPGSATKPFTISGEILKGAIPKHSEIKKIRLQLYHDWTDALVKDNAVLTLRFNNDGSLFDIEEFHFTGIGK